MLVEARPGANGIRAGERLVRQTDVQLPHVRCKGAVPALNDLREKLALLGTSDVPTQSAREFGSFLAAETERYARVIKAAGLKLDTPNR